MPEPEKMTAEEITTDQDLHRDMRPDDSLPEELLELLRAQARKLGVSETLVER